MCSSSEDAKPVWLRWGEFYKRRNWLMLSNFTWEFTKRPVRDYGAIVKDLFLFAFFENGNVLCEQGEVDENFARDTYIAAVSSRRDIWADMPWDYGLPVHKCLNHWAICLHLLKERTKTRGDLMSVRLEAILMKLLLGTCLIAEPFRSYS